MPKITPFEKYVEQDQYEEWFVENSWVYGAELRAVKAMLPAGGHGVEIGVGTGRFAEPLGIGIGHVITKVSAQWMKGPVIIRRGNTDAAVGYGMAGRIMVEYAVKGGGMDENYTYGKS